MTTRTPSLAASCLALLLTLFLPAVSAAQESSEAAAALAKSVTAYPTFRQAVADSFRVDLPPGAAVEIGLALLEGADPLWAALEKDLAVGLGAAMEPADAQTTAERFAQTPDEEWQADGQSYLDLANQVMTEATETGRQIGIVACTAGIFGSNIDLARRKAAETDQRIEIDAVFMERLAPLVASATLTCTCMLDRTQAEFGDEFMGESEEANEQQKLFAQQLVESGECPNPFAGLPEGE